VQKWVATLKLKPASVRKYVQTFRAVLDFAGVDPNPAKPVRLPREEQVEIDPPSAAEVETIIATTTPKWRLPLRVLVETGCGSASCTPSPGATWTSPVPDSGSGRARRPPRGAGSPCPRTSCARSPRRARGRTGPPSGSCSPGATPVAVWNAMARACTDAGIAHRHPHDLRHRYASVQIARGVPVTAVAAQLGHSKKSLTLDTYSHVLLED
jgi:integrase